jgi:hypothetical protein
MVYDAYTALMIPGASVTLFEIMRGTSYSQVTDSSGVAYFYNLPSSRYSVSVNKSGYYESNHEEAVGGDMFTGLLVGALFGVLVGYIVGR